MDETENQAYMPEETQVAEVAAPLDDSNQEQILDNAQVQSDSKADHQERGWAKRLRQDRDDFKRESMLKDEIIRKLMNNPVTPAQPTQVREDLYVAGSEVAQVLKQQKEDFDVKFEELKRHSDQQKVQSMFNDLKREFTDFDDVVNPDTLQLLDETYPRLAQTIAKNKDPYDAALLAYETIKAKGLIDKVPGVRRAKEVEKRLEQNKKTVQTPQAFEKRPMAQAFRTPETKQEKEALFKEMMGYASQSGGGY